MGQKLSGNSTTWTGWRQRSIGPLIADQKAEGSSPPRRTKQAHFERSGLFRWPKGHRLPKIKNARQITPVFEIDTGNFATQYSKSTAISRDDITIDCSTSDFKRSGFFCWTKGHSAQTDRSDEK